MINPVEIPAEKIVMEHDSNKVFQVRSSAENVLPWLQEVIDDFILQETGVPVTMEVINKLVYGPGADEFVREALAGTEPVKVGVVTLSRERVKSMLDVPNLHYLIKSVASLKGSLQSLKNHHHAGLELFAIKNGKAQVSEKALQEVAERYTTYAETEAEKEAWLIAQEVKERLEYLKGKYNVQLFDNINPARGIMQQVIEGYNPVVSKVRINAYLFKQQVKGKYRNN